MTLALKYLLLAITKEKISRSLVLFPLAKASMKNTGRLTLAELKAKAEVISNEAALEKVKGGNWSDCHGFSGRLGKWWRGETNVIVINP